MAKKRWMKGSILLGAGLLLFGCATAQDVRILDREIRMLHSQMSAVQKERTPLQKERESLQKERESLQKEFVAFQKETQKELSALQAETKRLQADFLLRLETLQSDIRVLSTGVEEYKDFLKRPSKEIDRVREDIALRTRILEERGKAFEEKTRVQEDRAKALEKALEEKMRGLEERLKGMDGKIDGVSSKLVEVEKAATAPKEKEALVEVKTGPATGMGDLYKEAFDTLQKGDLEGARRRFEAFLKQYPNTELSDNAQFWIGETYYLKKDYEKAILEYEKVIVKHPEGDKVPSALLKQALAFLELGDRTNGRNLLKRLIERYPQSDQVETAKKRLETIK